MSVDGPARIQLSERRSKFRGEPSQPAEPAKGHVWRAICDQINTPDSSTEWLNVIDLARSYICRFPLSLAGGGSLQLKEQLENAAACTLGGIIADIGNMLNTREDDAYLQGSLFAGERVLKITNFASWPKAQIFGIGAR